MARRDGMARVGGVVVAALLAAAMFVPLSGDLSRDAQGDMVYVMRSLLGIRLVYPELPFATFVFLLLCLGAYWTFRRR